MPGPNARFLDVSNVTDECGGEVNDALPWFKERRQAAGQHFLRPPPLFGNIFAGRCIILRLD